MKDKTLPYSISPKIALLLLINENLYLHIFSHLKSVIPLPLTNKLLRKINCQSKLISQCGFQSQQYVYEIFQNVNPALQNHIAKNI